MKKSAQKVSSSQQVARADVVVDAGRKRKAHVEIIKSEEAPIGRFAALDPEKLRGGYYTPAPVAAWLAKWALRHPTETFLEPSCGDGSILGAGAQRLLALGASPELVAGAVRAVELTPGEADAARRRITDIGIPGAARIVDTDDFFSWFREYPNRKFDAVIGNPPFIRYQSFPEPARSRAMALMENSGLHPNKLTNMWVPFVVAATEALRAGGRMALVIPAEIMQVSYAAQLRAFLTERFEHVGIVTCNQLFFDGAEQEVVLLLAEGAIASGSPGNRCRIAMLESATVLELLACDPAALLAASEEKDIRGGDGEKWLKLFLSAADIEFMREIRKNQMVSELSRFARVDVGLVTGNNGWFVLRGLEVKSLGLTGMTEKLVCRSAHLRGAMLSEGDWKALSDANERVHLLNIRQQPGETLHPAAAAYIKEGEREKVHLGYKCSIRKPWFHVPSLWNPDAFLFRQIHDFPRFVKNDGGATATDTLHRVTTHGCDPKDLIASTYTHLAAASAELVGRSYGGGVLELEPTEAEKLLMPGVLGSALPLEEADKLIRAGRLADVLAENDKRVLQGALGFSVADCSRLRAIWDQMRNRRTARNRHRRKNDD